MGDALGAPVEFDTHARIVARYGTEGPADLGQAYGVAHTSELTTGSTSDVLARLLPVAMEKWESDELIWIKPH